MSRKRLAVVVCLTLAVLAADPYGAQSPAEQSLKGPPPRGSLPDARPSPGQSLKEPSALDYQFFKTRVEPIFLKKRAGHARCYVCHAESNNAFRLEKLEPGKTFWTEEQSRRNFSVVSALTAGGDTGSARLLLHPLAPEAGGDPFHSGGRQFATKADPDWKTLAEWVRGSAK